MSSLDIFRMIKKDGWFLKAIVGSHHHFIHPTKSGKATVPHPKKNLPQGTINNILKQTGLK